MKVSAIACPGHRRGHALVRPRSSTRSVRTPELGYFFFPILSHFSGLGPSLSHGPLGDGGGDRFGGLGSHGPLGLLIRLLWVLPMMHLLGVSLRIVDLEGSEEERIYPLLAYFPHQKVKTRRSIPRDGIFPEYMKTRQDSAFRSRSGWSQHGSRAESRHPERLHRIRGEPATR